VALLSGLLECALAERRGLDKFHRKRDPRIWPASTAELLPGDPALAVQVLVSWAGLLPDIISQAPIRFLTIILDAVRTYALASLLQASALVDWLHRTLARWTVEVNALDLAQPILTADTLFTTTALLDALDRVMFNDELQLWASRGPSADTPALVAALCAAQAAVACITAPASPALRPRLRRATETPMRLTCRLAQHNWAAAMPAGTSAL
jgi:hypothetical protein